MLKVSGASLRCFGDGPAEAELQALRQQIEQPLMGRGTSAAWATLEDATTGVFAEFSYRAKVAARSKDGGIDVMFDHDSLGDVYAQVKHTKNKAGVRVLREVVGTMAIGGITSSLLVTSSDFTRGVERERAPATQRGFVVELVYGARLLSSLNLAFRSEPPTVEDVLTLARPSIELVRGEVNV